MRRLLALALCALAGASCAPKPARTFVVGLAGPLAQEDRAAAASLGCVLREEVEPDAVSAAAGTELADFSRLRWLGALSAIRGESALFFSLPPVKPGLSLSGDYPEEWQALARTISELETMRPIIEAGTLTEAPLALPTGVQARAWRYQGRLFVALANVSRRPQALDRRQLAGFRALFESRADPAQVLPRCEGESVCLPPSRALWLEARYE